MTAAFRIFIAFDDRIGETDDLQVRRLQLRNGHFRELLGIRPSNPRAIRFSPGWLRSSRRNRVVWPVVGTQKSFDWESSSSTCRGILMVRRGCAANRQAQPCRTRISGRDNGAAGRKLEETDTEGMNETTTFPVTKTDEEWRKLLTPQQYAVLRNHATEAPGSCALLREHRAGTFSCAACGQ